MSSIRADANAGPQSIEWASQHGTLRVVEPDAAEVASVAATLAAYYNDGHNAAMMAHTSEMSAADVEAHFARLRGEAGRGFLLYLDGALMGDADLRHIEADRAEFAFMVGARAAQGKGLGTRYGVMVNAFAFQVLGVARVFASILPNNHASLRAFEKMGFHRDASADARRYADEESDVTVSISRADFERHHHAALAHLRFAPRP